jgi:aquaporin Z
VNPAVSFGVFAAGRLSVNELVGYVIAQCLGAIVGAGALYLIASGAPDFNINVNGLGQNGFGAHSPGHYALWAGLVFEAIATFLFVVTILGVTQSEQTELVAGLVIGLTLTAIHIVGIQVTGVSVNPARSLGPALIVGGDAAAQLWVFIVAPLVGGGIAGLAFRIKFLSARS